MSSSETPTLIPPTQSHSRARTVLAWLVVLGLVGLTAWGNSRAASLNRNDQGVIAEQTRIFGMLALQMKSLAGGTNSKRVQQQMNQWILELEKIATAADDKLRLSILAGESIGAEAALTRLAELAKIQVSDEAAADLLAIRTIYEDSPDALESASRETLIERFGYLGRMALSYGVPADREPRRTVEAEAFWFMLRMTILALVFLAMLVLALGLFVAACVSFSRGKIKSAHLPVTSASHVFLEGFVLYLLLFLSFGVLLRLAGSINIQWTWIAALILPLVWAWVARRTSASERREAFGWHRGRGFIQEAIAGIAGYLAGIPVIAVGCIITLILLRFTGATPGSPITRELDGGPLQLLALYGLACVFAPIVEETMFRGLLLHHLRQRWSWLVSAPVVSFVFAMLHPQGWVALPALGSIAIVLAALREWRGSLIAPMTAHACNNFLALTVALLVLR